jgi:branched-subunit amino acid aminotransferase/4-amino-4-deoxychorismate lyase
MVKNGVVHTQEDSANILQGITRHKILDLAEQLNIPVKFENFYWKDFVNADEAFCSSATKEVMPIHSLDGKIITEGPGSVTAQLMSAYTEHIKSYCDKAKGVHPIAW